MSPSLYVQMVGRGMRLADGKTDCLLLDYGGNIARHGPIDDVKVKPKGKKGDGEAPTKICPQCMAVQAPAVRVCGHCGYEWPAPERKANDKASNLPALSLEIKPPPPPQRHDVGRVEWVKHYKAGDDTAPPTLRIDYYPESNVMGLGRKIASEWVCVQHEEGGFAWRKAMRWWEEHVGCRLPESVDDAISMLDDGHMRPVVAIETTKEGKWDRVTAIHHGERKEPGDDEGGTPQATQPMRPCAECGRVPPDGLPIVRKVDSAGRSLYYRQCSSCLGNHGGVGKWLPHTPEIESIAVDEAGAFGEDDLPW